MKVMRRSPLGLAVLCAGLLATGCSRQAPSTQTPLAPTTPLSELRTRASDVAVVFPLVRGSFAVENGGGDGITGTYTGSSTFGSSGRQTTSLALQVTGGSGVFAGAIGSLVVTGQGAFAGEGAFALDGNGEVKLTSGRRAVLVLKMRGRSTADCTASNQIAISQTADGTLGRVGRVSATLSHAVESTGCSS